MRIARRLAARANAPQELLLGWPRAVLVGDERLTIEQHQGIYVYTDTEIIVKTACGLLVVDGNALALSQYCRDTLVILGKIAQVSFRMRNRP